MTWGPYLYTTVSDKHHFFFASDSVFPVTSWLCSPCWMMLAWQTSAARHWRYRKRWSSSSSRRPQSFGPWLRRWWSRSVLGGGGTLPHDSKRMFYEFLFSRQNTNGVNFYNILAQDPEEKLSEKLGFSTENFMGKTQDQIIPVSSWLDPEAGHYTRCSVLLFFFPTPPQSCRYIATSDLSTGSR